MNTKTKEQLKPCPFCGAGYINDTECPTGEELYGYLGFIWVCPEFGCIGPTGAKSVKEATMLWNKRHE